MARTRNVDDMVQAGQPGDPSQGDRPSGGIVGQDEAARLEQLSATRLSKLTLPPDLLAAYKVKTFRSSQKMLASWCRWIACVNFACGAFDFGELQFHVFILALEVRFTISCMFLLAAQLASRHAVRRRPYLVIIIPCLVTVFIGNLTALFAHSNELFVLYMSMSVVVVYTAIMFLQIDLAQAIFMAIVSICLLTGFTVLSSLATLAEKIQLMIFLSGVMAALINARRIQNLTHHRIFVLQLRDEQRSKDMGNLNQQLTSIAYTDRLTDIPNRRFFDEQLEAMRAAPQTHLPLALCLVDIDNFKMLNDRLGHVRGDRCLQMVAITLRDHLRSKTDLVARYGGEEFGLILPQTSMQAATQLMERLRLAVRALNLPNPDAEGGYVTISAGIAVADGGVFVPHDLLNQADRALYRAKTAGRNQVCV